VSSVALTAIPHTNEPHRWPEELIIKMFTTAGCRLNSRVVPQDVSVALTCYFDEA
jgi:hypothetical protein